MSAQFPLMPSPLFCPSVRQKRVSRKVFLGGWIKSFLLSLFLLCSLPVQGKAPLKVVASFSILANIAKVVGGDAVEVTAVVGCDSDAHVYEPKPQDAKALLEACLILTNGLGFEGWINRLIEASGAKAPVVAIAESLQPFIYDQGGKTPDPHVWTSPRQGLAYVDGVCRALSDVAPEHKALFAANSEVLKRQLQDLDRRLIERVRCTPVDKRVLITSHEAFAYLSRDYTITCYSLFGVDTNSEPSAKDMTALVGRIHTSAIKGLFVENVTNPALIEQVAAETHVPILGTLYSDALSASGPATTYVDLLRHNLALMMASWE